ncbi:unnamed protein product [Paramecium sonneborni]|uniref:Uncharacterized protein n=1 Tax=Paramecium sonneborni TaxID=65129 RepID=A0A8S1QYP9_9CILI|nr:unnamed protein product [Paramecium sonneborni]
MDFLGIKNNKFIKNKEHLQQQEEICMGDNHLLQLEIETHIIVPKSPNFKFIQTIKRKRNH